MMKTTNKILTIAMFAMVTAATMLTTPAAVFAQSSIHEQLQNITKPLQDLFGSPDNNTASSSNNNGSGIPSPSPSPAKQGEVQSESSSGGSNLTNTYTNLYHGVKLQYPEDWQLDNTFKALAMTDGSYTLVDRFDWGLKGEPFLNVAYYDLSHRGNLTMGQFSQERIAEIKEPDIVGGKTLFEHTVIQSNQTLLANHTAYRVVSLTNDTRLFLYLS